MHLVTKIVIAAVSIIVVVLLAILFAMKVYPPPSTPSRLMPTTSFSICDTNKTRQNAHRQ